MSETLNFSFSLLALSSSAERSLTLLIWTDSQFPSTLMSLLAANKFQCEAGESSVSPFLVLVLASSPQQQFPFDSRFHNKKDAKGRQEIANKETKRRQIQTQSLAAPFRLLLHLLVLQVAVSLSCTIFQLDPLACNAPVINHFTCLDGDSS